MLWDYLSAQISFWLYFLLKFPSVPDAIAFDSVVLSKWERRVFSGRAQSVGGVSHTIVFRDICFRNTETTLCPCTTVQCWAVWPQGLEEMREEAQKMQTWRLIGVICWGQNSICELDSWDICNLENWVCLTSQQFSHKWNQNKKSPHWKSRAKKIHKFIIYFYFR